MPPTSAYLTPAVVLQAVAALARAAAAAASPYALRLQTLWLAPVYVVLLRWVELRAWAAAHSVAWPLPAAPLDAYDAFAAVYAAAGLGGGLRGALSESGHDLVWLKAQLPAADSK